MMLNDLKELEKFFKICRKQGVTEIAFEGVNVKFGELPQKIEHQDEGGSVQTDALTPDELMFYAVENAGPI